MKNIFYTKVPTNYFGIFLLFLMFIGVSCILCVSVFAFIGSLFGPIYIDIISLLLSLLFLLWISLLVYADLFAIDYILWNIKGYEEVNMDERELIIRKKGMLMKSNISIKLSEIESIQEQNIQETWRTLLIQNTGRFSRIIGETGGKILVKYGKNGKWKIDFGLGLSDSEAKIYVEQMNNILKTNTLATTRLHRIAHEEK